MTPYDLLRARINELLPERLELKFGCEIDVLGQWCDRMTVLYECSKCRRHKTTAGCEKYEGDCDYDDAVCALQDQYLDCPLEWVVKTSDIETILGPELTITDVLRALNTPGNYVRLEPDGWLRNIIGVGIIKMPFNLTAPLSDPSNAPACEAVLKLLDSEKV